MAETKPDTQANRTQGEKQGERSLASQHERRGLSRREPALGPLASPFELMDRMTEEMDRLFERVTGQTAWPRRSGLARPMFASPAREGVWFPRVETMQKGDMFVVRADLPGLKKDEVEVDITDEALTIRGERREEHQEEREGYWRSEREYGQFHRTIPLPEGVITESAEASFRDGVLEIRMQAPPAEAGRGRRLEIKQG